MNATKLLQKLQKQTSENFKISSYGDLSWFFNFKIEGTENKIMLRQEAYIEELIEKYKMSDSRTLKTPLDVSSKLPKLDSPKIGSKEYQFVQSCDYRGKVGCLNYLASSSRQDITHIAIISCSFVENPGKKHCNAAKAFQRYLKGTKSENLIYKKSDKLDLKGFSDSDWANNWDSGNSTSGYCFKLDNSTGAISWASKLQKCVSTSTAKAELYEVVEAREEALHVANVLKGMNIDVEQPLQVFADNRPCIDLSKNSMNDGKTKHLTLKMHFIRNLVQNSLLELNNLPTDRMPADTLTKVSGRTKISLFRDVLLGSNT